VTVAIERDGENERFSHLLQVKGVRMNRPTSLYLDIVRFLAALAVFLDHLSGQHYTGGLFWQSQPYGDEAVDVFFVLSGFVIGYVTAEREATARLYGIARLSRIYSVALPALIATFSLDALGRAIRPELYGKWWGYVSDGRIVQFISNLVFCNRLWWLRIGEGSNLSYWSLNYEVWYYTIFGLAIFGGSWRFAWVVIATIVAGPCIISLFPLWLLGVYCYRLCARATIGWWGGLLLCLGSLVLWVAYEIFAWHGGQRHIVPMRIVNRDLIVQDYVISLLFAANLVGFHAISPSFALALERHAVLIRWGAGATFTIYLFHQPVAQFLTTIIPWPPTSWITRLLMFPGVIAVMFGIAELTERRKEWWRRAFTQLTGRLIGTRAVTSLRG
jgi:peptidoglycan/LPS O-acetylase OafA/YrhL